MNIAAKYLINTITASPKDDGLPSCVISTINPDRDHDRVVPEGMDAKNFMKAPTLFWAHGAGERYAAVPIGSVTSLDVTPGQGIKATWRWLENDAFAARIKNAWDQGVVRGTSIGFRPIKMTPNDQGGVDHEAWELLELSVAPVPANPECVRTLKGLGLMDEPATLYGPDGKLIAKVVELGDSEKRSRLEAALQEKYPSDPKAGWYFYLIDVFDAYVIFRDKDGKYQRLDYTMDVAGVVSFTGDPSEVAVQYVPLTSEGKIALEAIQKRGRVLSAVNESRLRAALTALSEVLSQLMPMDDEEDEEHPKPKPIMPMDEAASDGAIQFVFDEPTVLRLTLDDSDEPILTLVDDQGHEPLFAIDPKVMQAVIAETVKEHLQHSLVEPVGQMVQQALDQARGRVH